MAKFLKKTKRWMEDYGRVLGITSLVLAVVVAGVWHATSTEEAPVQEDFGDASISEVAQEISKLSYEDALRLWDAGDLAKARAVMQRLAPLSLANKKPQGNGLAHVWLAKDMLDAKYFGVLDRLPVEAYNGKLIDGGHQQGVDPLFRRALEHLEAAVALLPEHAGAVQARAEILLADGKRNQAISGILEAVGGASGTQLLELAPALAHLTCYQGDLLGQEERAWHHFATLGKEVVGEKRAMVGARLDYFLTGLLLKEYEVAERAGLTVQRDFGDAHPELASLPAYLPYFRAVAGIVEGAELEAIADLLAEAIALAPKQPQLLKALEALTAAYPELAERVLDRVGALAQAQAQLEPELALLLVAMAPERGMQWVDKALQGRPEHQGLLLTAVELDLQAGKGVAAERLAALEAMLEEAGQDASLAQRATLCLAEVAVAEENWEAAVLLVERSKLNGAQVARKHAILGQAYAGLGDGMLAAEHEALAK